MSHKHRDDFFFFIWLKLWDMGVPGLGAEMELQLKPTP